MSKQRKKKTTNLFKKHVPTHTQIIFRSIYYVNNIIYIVYVNFNQTSLAPVPPIPAVSQWPQRLPWSPLRPWEVSSGWQEKFLNSGKTPKRHGWRNTELIFKDACIHIYIYVIRYKTYCIIHMSNKCIQHIPKVESNWIIHYLQKIWVK